MSKTQGLSDNLHSLQKRIILNLAENEPQTKNEIAEATSKSYKPTWTALNSLQKKKLIGKVDLKDYRGRKFPRYWLTDEGMIMALMEGASSERLLEQTKILYPDAKIIHCFLEMMPFIDPEITRMAYSSIKGKGKLGFAEVAALFLSQAAAPMEIETAKKLTAVLKKYPNEYLILKTAIQEMITRLNQLIED